MWAVKFCAGFGDNMPKKTKQRPDRDEKRLDPYEQELRQLRQEARQFVEEARRLYDETRQMREEVRAMLARQKEINALLERCLLPPGVIIPPEEQRAILIALYGKRFTDVQNW